ncbi:MAG: peptidylprolyl isomerase [Oscillospiraceae bacterium]
MKLKLLTILLTLILAITAAGCKVVDLPEQSQEAEVSEEESIPEEEPAEPAEVQPDREEIPEQPLTTLADHVVYSSDYVYYYNLYRSNMIAQYGAFMDMNTFWEQEIDGQTVQQYLTDETLAMVKESAVLYNAAIQAGMKLSQEELDKIHSDIQSVLEAQFENNEQKFLNAFALTPEQMKGMLERSSLVTQYVNKALDEIEVSQEEIAEYYKNNQDSLDRVTVRHILIDCTDEMSEEEQSQAKAKAEDLLAQVQGGADIGKLAAEHSTDPGSKDNNGEYTFGKGQMVPEFEEWAFAAKPGDQGMVKTSYGYHIMEKMDHSDLESVKSQIVQILQQEKFPQQYSHIFDQANSPDWSLNQELLDQIIAAAL